MEPGGDDVGGSGLVRGSGWDSELRERTCGVCGRTLYCFAGPSGHGLPPVFSCGGCRTRWTPEGLEVYVEEGYWSKVPSGCLVAREL